MEEDAEMRVMSLIINFEVAVKCCNSEKELVELMADTLVLDRDPDTDAPRAKLSEDLATELRAQCDADVVTELTEQLEAKALRALNLRIKRDAVQKSS